MSTASTTWRASSACGPRPVWARKAQARNVPRSRRICTKNSTSARSARPALYVRRPMHRDAPRPDGIPGSELSGPWPVGQYAARLRDRLREFARVQVFGEVFNLRAGRARVWFELRDERGALPCSMWRQRLRRAARAARRRPARRRGRRLRLLPRLARGVAVVLVRGRARCGSPARATCSPSSTGCAARSHAEGLFAPQKRLARPRAAALHRRRHRRGRQGARRRARRAAPARLGRPARVGVRAGPGPPRGARRHARAAGPRRLPGGRGRDRRPRRRLAGRPVRVLRRDAVPDRRAAARAGDRLGRPPHRPHADRRRRRRVVLDADARRRGRRPGRLPRGARRSSTASPRGSSARAAARSSSARGRWRGSRARRPTTSRATARGCTSTLRELRASAAPRAWRREHRHARHAARWCSSARRPRRPARLGRGATRAHADAAALDRGQPRPRGRGAPRRSSGSASRSTPTTRSARSSAATRWSRTRRGAPVTSAEAARAAARLTLRMADGTLPVRRDPTDGVDAWMRSVGRGRPSRSRPDRAIVAR